MTEVLILDLKGIRKGIDRIATEFSQKKYIYTFAFLKTGNPSPSM